MQFHPESILTEHGMDMLRAFLSWTDAVRPLDGAGGALPEAAQAAGGLSSAGTSGATAVAAI